jgi:hypothetical protein
LRCSAGPGSPIISKLLKNEQEFHNELKNLGDAMCTLLSCLTDVRYAARIAPAKASVLEILKAVLEAANFVDDYLMKNRLGVYILLHSDIYLMLCPAKFTSAQFRATLDDFTSQFRRLRDNYKDAMLTQIVIDVNDLKKDSLDNFLRHALDPPKRGVLGTRCMDGTRQDVLDVIDSWLTDLDKPNILWIRGSPGAGKTTISSTLASKYPSAKFFFRRDVAHLRGPTPVWRCLAYDLAGLSVTLKERIATVLKEKLTQPADADVEEQFENLIEVPLRDCAEGLCPKHLVTIVDALDECSSDDKQWRPFLLSLRRWSRLPKAFKLVITSRDYLDIRKTLVDISQHVELSTGDGVDPRTSSDLQHFFTTRFAEIAEEYSPSLPPDWPGPAKVAELTRYAAGLFIWAETVLNFIRNGDPERRLLRISDKSREAGASVDNLYREILESAVHGLLEDEREILDTVLGAIVIAKDPLRYCDLQKLMRVPATMMQFIVGKLGPVISTSGSDGPLRACHKSFADFLLDDTRSASFAVDSATQSMNLARACLQQMNKELRFNILGLSTSHCFNGDIPDRESRINRAISTSLIHSSCYWAEYLGDRAGNGVHDHAVLGELKEFLYEHLLHWLEVLSLIQGVSSATQLLLRAGGWIVVSVV